MLYLQSFLTNIAEFNVHTIVSTTVWPCLCAYDIFSYLPESTAHNVCNVTYLQEKCPLLCHLLAHKTTTAFDSHQHASLHALRVSDLLVEILHLEAIDFLVDLEETDAAINNNQPQPQPQGAVQPVHFLFVFTFLSRQCLAKHMHTSSFIIVAAKASAHPFYHLRPWLCGGDFGEGE